MILPLYYLPNLQYISKFFLPLLIGLEQHEHYNKGSFRNRCHIATATGRLLLHIPLKKGKHEQMPIREVLIDNEQAWQRQHWRSIAIAYGKAPFWEYYGDQLAPFFEREYERLFDWNADLLSYLLGCVGYTQPLTYTNEFVGKLDAQSSIFSSQLIHPKNKAIDPQFTPLPYTQTFADRQPFLPNLSLLDALFCLGPRTRDYILRCIAP